MNPDKRTTDVIRDASDPNADIRAAGQAELVARYWEMGRNIVRSRVNPAILQRVGASDVTNAALRSMLSDLEHQRVQFVSSDQFENVLRVYFRAKAIDYVRKHKGVYRSVNREVALDDTHDFAAPGTEAATQDIAVQELLAMVGEYLETIQDPAIREAVEMSLLAGWTAEEIQNWLAFEQPNQLKRGLRALQLQIAQHRKKCAAFLRKKGLGPDDEC